MFVPAEQVIVLVFLLVGHLHQAVVQLGEHEQIGEGQMVAHEESARLQVLLQVLSEGGFTFRSYLPYL